MDKIVFLSTFVFGLFCLTSIDRLIEINAINTLLDWSFLAHRFQIIEDFCEKYADGNCVFSGSSSILSIYFSLAFGAILSMVSVVFFKSSMFDSWDEKQLILVIFGSLFVLPFMVYVATENPEFKGVMKSSFYRLQISLGGYWMVPNIFLCAVSSYFYCNLVEATKKLFKN